MCGFILYKLFFEAAKDLLIAKLKLLKEQRQVKATLKQIARSRLLN